MTKETIRIYARLKPLDGDRPACLYEVTSHQDRNERQADEKTPTQNEVLQFSIAKQAADGYINNSRELFRFHFDGILREDSSQAAVFELVARPVVDRVLDGYNGTLFAYGQTGSGKTFTITGDNGLLLQGGRGSSTDSEGIIPRTLAHIFSQLPTANNVIQVSCKFWNFYNFKQFFYILILPLSVSLLLLSPLLTGVVLLAREPRYRRQNIGVIPGIISGVMIHTLPGDARRVI